MKVKTLTRDGRSVPTLFCDICDKAIDGSESAEYLIPSTPEGEYGEIIVGHYTCTKPLEKERFAATDGDVMYGNMSLGHLLLCLVSNTKTDLAQERKAADAMSMIA